MQNLPLILGIALLAFLFFRRFAFANSPNVKNVSADEAHELLKSDRSVVVIDVRTRQEYKSGHINGAKSIPVNEISSRIGELEKYKDTPVLIHCASGGRSPAAVRALLKNNFTKVYHMRSGLLGWKYGLK